MRMILPSLTSTMDAFEPFSGTPQKLMSRTSVRSPSTVGGTDLFLCLTWPYVLLRFIRLEAPILSATGAQALRCVESSPAEFAPRFFDPSLAPPATPSRLGHHRKASQLIPRRPAPARTHAEGAASRIAVGPQDEEQDTGDDHQYGKDRERGVIRMQKLERPSERHRSHRVARHTPGERQPVSAPKERMPK